MGASRPPHGGRTISGYPPRGCVAPEEITADALLAFVFGEADAAITRHVARCTACRKEAHAYARLSDLIRVASYRRSCPPALLLLGYSLGHLDGPLAQAVAAHLTDCRYCRAEIDAIRGDEDQ